MTTPNEDGFVADLHIVDGPAYRDLTPKQIAALTPAPSLDVIADNLALTSSEHPLLVIQLTERGTEHLRVIADELWSIENNISLGNMNWAEFAHAVDDDGIFRGF